MVIIRRVLAETAGEPLVGNGHLGLIALIWLTVRVMKRLQQLERQQKQQREETQDPVSVELNAQQRYLDGGYCACNATSTADVTCGNCRGIW